MDIAELKELGKVIVMGDLNARIGKMQIQPIMLDEMDKDEAIEADILWHRSSKYETVNPQGRALRCMINGLHMPVLNGM